MKITAELTDTMEARLFVSSHGFKSAAGPRLFRAHPHPSISFGAYSSIEQCEHDAKKLQDYLDALPVKKISKDKLRKYHDQ